jgi:hypothetical protein
MLVSRVRNVLEYKGFRRRKNDGLARLRDLVGKARDFDPWRRIPFQDYMLVLLVFFMFNMPLHVSRL